MSRPCAMMVDGKKTDERKEGTKDALWNPSIHPVQSSIHACVSLAISHYIIIVFSSKRTTSRRSVPDFLCVV